MSLLTAGGLLAGNTRLTGATNNPAIQITAASKALGLQIYSLFRELYDDVPKRMRELKAMGYVNLELSGYDKGKIGGVDMMEFKKMASDAGLKLVSSHVNPSVEGPGSLVSGMESFFPRYTKEMLPQVREYWKATAADHATLGCKYLIQPMMPNIETHDDAGIVCEFFNEAGKICKEAGLIFGYHNHNFEFKRLVKPEDADRKTSPWVVLGDQIMDLFLAGTDPSLVNFELDVYWTVRGGNDPLEYMKKFPQRIKALHIKDTVVLGQSGLLNFENIFKQMYANGIQDFFVELERMPDRRPQFEGVKECAEYLQKATFIL
jgi:sugar phosphate isomerase/epimerase